MITFMARGSTTPQTDWVIKVEGNPNDHKRRTRLVMTDGQTIFANAKFKEFLAARMLADKTGGALDITPKGLVRSGAGMKAALMKLPPRAKQDHYGFRSLLKASAPA